MAAGWEERARALAGTRFRAQGRDAATGLDCAGLIIATFGLRANDYRHDYRLRGEHRAELVAAMARDFWRVPRTQSRAGDVLMLGVARDLLHLAVKTSAGFVHADAGLGKVVETPGSPKWKVLAAYRRRAR